MLQVKKDSKEHLIAFKSKKFTSAKRNYLTYKRKLLAIVTSARFIARSALVEWSQLRLFKAKEEVIYKVRFVHKYRVLPLHTACASHASARDMECQNRNSY